MLTIDKTIIENKAGLLEYFRLRANESLEELTRKYGSPSPKKLREAINSANINTKDNLLSTLRQKIVAEDWTNEEILRAILIITYCHYVVMIECRNDASKYEYMSFSRRIGELWERFCKLCFDYPVTQLELYLPPLFAEVQSNFNQEIVEYTNSLQISGEERDKLNSYYNKVWSFVDSGEIKLESDLHFIQNTYKYVVDFKSGFSSNEKGNTNRLLLVATIYKNLEENYKCVLLVRAEEERNNSYFKRLINSGVWEGYCGQAAYEKIHEYSGFNLKEWISKNINWAGDFKVDTIEYLTAQGLEGYLKW